MLVRAVIKKDSCPEYHCAYLFDEIPSKILTIDIPSSEIQDFLDSEAADSQSEFREFPQMLRKLGFKIKNILVSKQKAYLQLENGTTHKKIALNTINALKISFQNNIEIIPSPSFLKYQAIRLADIL